MFVLQAYGLPDAPAGEEQHNDQEAPQVSPEAPGEELLPPARQASPALPCLLHFMPMRMHKPWGALAMRLQFLETQALACCPYSHCCMPGA